MRVRESITIITQYGPVPQNDIDGLCDLAEKRWLKFLTAHQEAHRLIPAWPVEVSGVPSVVVHKEPKKVYGWETLLVILSTAPELVGLILTPALNTDHAEWYIAREIIERDIVTIAKNMIVK